MVKILFYHNTIMPYRVPFFEALSKEYNVQYVFSRIELCNDLYSLDPGASQKKMTELTPIVLEGSYRRLKAMIELNRSPCDLVIDSLENTAPFTYLMARIKGRKIIFWSEEIGLSRNSIRTIIMNPVKKYLAIHSDALVVPGSQHKKYFTEIGVDESRIFIAPNASNVTTMGRGENKNGELKTQLGIEKKEVILFVGRLIKRKGVDVLIKAFKEISKTKQNVALVIVGKGPCMQELKDLCIESGVQNETVFAGYVPDCELQYYYHIADVCVIPSISFEMKDPWVFVVNEALHHGRPIVVTDAVGAAFDAVLEGVNGHIVCEGDFLSLSNAILDIIGDSVTKEKMGSQSKLISQSKFTYENMMNGFRSGINFALEGHPKH